MKQHIFDKIINKIPQKYLRILVFLREKTGLSSNPAVNAYARARFHYGHIRRFCETKIKLGKFVLLVPDVPSVLWQFYDIFVCNSYLFHSPCKRPVILDIGANVGLAVLFYLERYPEAQIFAYEADPVIFEYLKKNLERNGGDSATLYNQAVARSNDGVFFQSCDCDGGHIVNAGTPDSQRVASISFGDLLDRHEQIDFLKMDIEGGENDLLPGIGNRLKKCRNIFIEYHCLSGDGQKLDLILAELSQNHFVYHLSGALPTQNPFAKFDRKSGGDIGFQLHIHAQRVDQK